MRAFHLLLALLCSASIVMAAAPTKAAPATPPAKPPVTAPAPPANHPAGDAPPSQPPADNPPAPQPPAPPAPPAPPPAGSSARGLSWGECLTFSPAFHPVDDAYVARLEATCTLKLRYMRRNAGFPAMFNPDPNLRAQWKKLAEECTRIIKSRSGK